MTKTDLYILKRRLIAFTNSICFYMCRVFPIRKNLVSVCTFEGKGGFGCNPKYVIEELHRQNPEIEVVWFVNENVFEEKQFPDYIKKVPNTLWSRAYWLSRSKVWIDNYRKPYGTVKRKGQYYLNVNHYTIGIKCTGLWRGDGFSKMAYIVSKADSDMMDALVIDSKWCDVVSPKGLLYEGRYLKTGAPRCDVLFGDRENAKKEYRKEHNLPEDAKIVLFAPTFREGAQDGKRFVYSQEWSIDFKKLIKTLESKFGNNWYIVIRVHPQLAASFENYSLSDIEDRIINDSTSDDMYRILAASDAYITDYSSACFEAGFAKIPTFIYADDIDEYADKRGELMWNIASERDGEVGNNKEITPQFDVKFPFSIAENNEELEKNINDFSAEKYAKQLDGLYEELGLVFDGKASNKIAEEILKQMK